MSKILKYILIGALVVVGALFIGTRIMISNTKKSSPEATVTYQQGGKDLSVTYCRPSKKGREIFGAMLPYEEVWRTGANEATTFTTATDIEVGRQTLPAGTYTLWTIPSADHWSVIFNSQAYSWGTGFDGVAKREAEYDVVKVDVATQNTTSPVEMFTIAFEGDALSMSLAWDQTKVLVPIK